MDNALVIDALVLVTPVFAAQFNVAVVVLYYLKVYFFNFVLFNVALF